jgi:hypothetical protein
VTVTDDTEHDQLKATQVTESISLAEATRGQATGRRMRIKLIDAGWGSSGYYSPEVLQEAARNEIFRDGFHMYIDHPTPTEQVEKPERSVRDLAAVIEGPVTYRDGGLYAEARLYDDYQWIAQKKDAIGLSIRASGRAEAGEADGRRGLIITALTEGTSVDFVTHAGRGGQILELLESARAQSLEEARNIGGWLESRLHCVFTEITDGMYGDGRLTRDERIGLSSAIGDALDAFVRRVEADYPQLYQRDLYDGPPEPGETSADMAETTTPAPPAQPLEDRMSGSTQQGTPPSGAAPTQISEADQLRAENTDLKSKLAEAELRAAQLGDNARELEETKRSLEDARRENLRLRANDAARARAVESLLSSTLPETAHERVIAAVTGDHVPLNDEGSLDEARLTEAIRTAIEAERRYLARFAEEAGIGSVRGLGSSGDPNEMTEADLESGLKDVFTTLGMPDTVADIAAKGR